MAKLTKMQQKIYDYIAETTRQQGYPPSVREIGEAVGLRSPSTVHFHLKHMEEMGVLTKGAGKGRALTLTPLEGAAPGRACVPLRPCGAGDARGPRPHRGHGGRRRTHPGSGVHRGLPDLRHQRTGGGVFCPAGAG